MLHLTIAGFGPTAYMQRGGPVRQPEQTRHEHNAEHCLRLAASCCLVYMRDVCQRLHMAHELLHPAQTPLWRWLQSHPVFSLFRQEDCGFLWISPNLSQGFVRAQEGCMGFSQWQTALLSDSAWTRSSLALPLVNLGTEFLYYVLCRLQKMLITFPHVLTQKQLTGSWNC